MFVETLYKLKHVSAMWTMTVVINEHLTENSDESTANFSHVNAFYVTKQTVI